ncbi:ABC transporter permease [Bacillus sp. EB106-08-02-XG196]|uniref:ABC transporter permease n=1 Tax=Bacillus sp. EB106-08-02-XG196 TaxID=2737049 RepID=UPI0015C45B82|nr:ABC transporter permease [Bacillus sp. EB106-08-02-XG196]NWQ43582.1 ABC transporter permease [Bacillus sp. EB106-08-02-XG196]
MTSWWLAWKDLMIIVRDKQALLTLIAMPLLLIAILGSAFGDMMDGNDVVTIKKFTLGIVNLDQGQLGGVLSEEVFEKELSDQIKVKYFQEEEMVEKIKEHKLDVGIVIDEEFTASLMTGEQASVKLITVPDPGIKATIVSSVMEQFAQTVPIEAISANMALPVQGNAALEEPSHDLLNVTSIDLDANPVSSFQYYAAAMGVMFLLMTVVQGVSTMILEKEQEVFKRLLISNLTYINYLTGKMIGLIVISLIQAFVIIIGTKFIFGVDWGNSIAGVVIMTFAFVISACGLGVLAGSFIKTEKAFNAAGMLGTQIFAALGGSMAPLYIFPDWFVSVSKILPNGLALQTYLDLMSGSSFFEIIPAVLSSIGLGLLFFAIGLFRLSIERRGKYA